MGAISTTFKLNASAAHSSLRSLEKNLTKIDNLVNKIDGRNISIGAGGSASGGASSMTSAFKSAEQQANKVAKANNKAAAEAKKIGDNIKGANKNAGSLTQTLVRTWAIMSGIRGIAMAIGHAFEFFNQSMLMANKTATALRNTVGTMGSAGPEAARVEMDKYYHAANRARTSYLEFANTASKFQIVAPGAFGSDDRAIRFTETLSKSLQLAGATTEELNSVLLQVSQGLSSGYLQGDELRALRENGGMAAVALADYFGVTVGELKELGAQGEITAEALIAAFEAAEGDINKAFDNLPKTISQQMTIAANFMQKSIEGIGRRIQDLMNTDSFRKFAESLMTAWTTIARGIAIVVEIIFGVLIPAITAVIGAFNWFFTSSDELATLLRTTLFTALVMIAAYFVVVGVQAAWAGLQALWAWAAALWPFFLVLAIIVAIISAIAAVAMAMGIAGDFVEGVFYAIGFIVGFVAAMVVNLIIAAIMVIATAIVMIITVVMAVGVTIFAIVSGTAVAIATLVLNAIAAIVHAFGYIVDALAGVATAASSAANAIANAFVEGINVAIGAINMLIDALNTVPGFSLSNVAEVGAVNLGDWGAGLAGFASDVHATADGIIDGLEGMQDGWTDLVGGMYSGIGDFASGALGSIANLGDNSFQNPFEMGDAWGQGAMQGGNDLIGLIEGLVPGEPTLPDESFLYDPTQGAGDSGGGPGGGGGGGGKGAAGKIAEDTNDIKNLLERLKDLAERDAVERFTSVNVNIDMNNTIENTDLDGVITYVTDQVDGALNNTLAGVVL